METVRKDIFGVDEVETPKGLNQIVNKISSDVSIDTFSASIQARWNFGNSPGSRPYYETLTAFSGDIIFFDGSFVGYSPRKITGLSDRIHAAVFSFCAGVMPPMLILNRWLLSSRAI